MLIVDFVKFIVDEFPRASLLEKMAIVLGCSAFVGLFAFVVFLASFMSWKDLIFLGTLATVGLMIVGWTYTMARYTAWREDTGRRVHYATKMEPRWHV